MDNKTCYCRNPQCPLYGRMALYGRNEMDLLLWLNGFPNLLELIVAHCSQSAQGRAHFITTRCCALHTFRVHLSPWPPMV
jgi:hypothetical protein